MNPLRTRRMLRRALPLIAVAITGGGAARAQTAGTTTLFSNLNAAGGAQPHIGYRMSPNPTVSDIAVSFVAPINASLSRIDVAISHSGSPTPASLQFAEDDGTGLPGAVLESFATVANGPLGFPPHPVVSLDSVLRPALVEGKTYWVIGNARPTPWMWNQSSTGGSGIALLNPETNVWRLSPTSTQGAVRVVGAPAAAAAVPEPGTIGLLALGAVALIRRRTRA